MRTAMNREGRLLARELECWFDTGAYADNGPRVTATGGARNTANRYASAVRERSPPERRERRRDVFAGGPSVDLDPGIEEVVGVEERQPARATREQRREQDAEVPGDVGERLLEDADDLLVDGAQDPGGAPGGCRARRRAGTAGTRGVPGGPGARRGRGG